MKKSKREEDMLGMEKRSLRFKITDVLLLILAALPIIFGIVLKILTNQPSEGIEINGARIFFTVSMPMQDLPITEAQVNSWLVIISVFWLCLWLTHGIAQRPGTRRQHFAEWAVEQTEKLVSVNMDKHFDPGFAPFVGAVLVISAFSSLLTLVGLYPPTSDINIVGGWSILVFILITYYRFKCGPIRYLKSFCEPVAPLAFLNVISEVATPVAMTFRHYGNILSGSVVSVLIAALLQTVSDMIFGNLPGILGSIPWLQIGLPAVLSIYFDVFSGCLQAFIFAMLTMLYVSGAFPAEDYEKRLERRKQKKSNI